MMCYDLPFSIKLSLHYSLSASISNSKEKGSSVFVVVFSVENAAVG